MIEDQLKPRGITDKQILKAFETVERHRFVSPNYKHKAYGDYPLPIDEGQTISQPYIVAFMTQSLNLKTDDKVLEIGTGSGYQAAILAEICNNIYTIEIFEKLYQKSKDLLTELGYLNVFFKHGDGYQGWVEHAPYDAIIVTCSPKKIPQPLIDQLAEDGKIIIPVGQTYGIQHLELVTKKKGEIKTKKVLPVRFVPMIDKDGKKY